MQASASIVPTPNLDTPTIVPIGQITLSPALRVTHAHFSHLNAYIWVSTKHSAAGGEELLLLASLFSTQDRLRHFPVLYWYYLFRNF